MRRTLAATLFLSPDVFPVYSLHNPIFLFPISDFSKILSDFLSIPELGFSQELRYGIFRGRKYGI
ncbi:hypothetical protein SLEP1_g50697 [Rubroshorea leprosula]|uniref:Uncharacterized protein n=1 Tax=Rubroshorea leprosula TaxID=152421 RepID=A0AAV5M3F4_9ROSI|nr:hypothetical protein SLEP1_g50697 [Rubroshorea leprosula]